MTVTELRALERLEADAHYLARLIERTMVEDAKLVSDAYMSNYVSEVQRMLNNVEALATQLGEHYGHGA